MSRIIRTKWGRYIAQAPTAKQLAFISLPHEEALYGGAAGGGKTSALLMIALQYFDCPGHRSIVFRRKITDHKLPNSIMNRALAWLSPWIQSGDVKYQAGEHAFYSKEGGILAFGYLDKQGDKERYQSSEYHDVCFDELTHFLEEEYLYLFSRIRRVRTNDVEKIYPLRMRGGCVDEGEVLAESGWVDIRDIVVGDNVWSPNKKGVLELKEVEQIYHSRHVGKLTRVRKKNLYMSMTPDHKVVYSKFNKSGLTGYEITPFDEHVGKCISIARAPTAIDAPGCGLSKTELAFMGIYVSEGSTPKPKKGNYKVIITQCHKDKAKLISKLLDRFGYNYCYSKNGDFQITNKTLWEKFHPLGKSHEKYIPQDILNTATKEELRTLFDWAVLGDGCVRGSAISYITVSKKLADNICEIGVKLGYKCMVKKTRLPGYPAHRDRYSVYLSLKDQPYTKVGKDPEGRTEISHEDYDGMVYCIKVKDNATFVLRQKGSVWLSGNTNPGGRGGPWVKKRWGIFKDEDGEFRGHNSERPFIQAKCRDNPYLDVVQYDRNLCKLDPITRNRLKDGDWSASENAIFKDWYFANRWIRKGDYYHLKTENELRIYNKDQLLYFTSVDSAASEKTGVEGRVLTPKKNTDPCWSVCGLFGMTPDYELLWIDNHRTQTTVPQFVRDVVKIHSQFKPAFSLIESNAMGAGVYQSVRDKGVAVIPMQSIADKVVRSTSAQLRSEVGKIWLPAYAEWLGDLEDELFTWTGLRGESDDQVDVLSLAASYVAHKAVGSEVDKETCHGSSQAFALAVGGLRASSNGNGGRNPFLQFH